MSLVTRYGAVLLHLFILIVFFIALLGCTSMTGFNHDIYTVQIDSTNMFSAVGLPLLPEVVGVKKGDIHRIGIWGYCDIQAGSCQETFLSGSLQGTLSPLSNASHTVAVLFLVSIVGSSIMLVIKTVLNVILWNEKHRSLHMLVILMTSAFTLLTLAATVTAQVLFGTVLELIATSLGAKVIDGPQLKMIWMVTVGLVVVNVLSLTTDRPGVMGKSVRVA